MSAARPNRVSVVGGRTTSVLNGRLQEQFRDLLELAGIVCESPEVAIHLFDEEDRRHTTSTAQKSVEQTLDACFCSHMNEQDGLLEIRDLRRDPRLRDHVLVTREPNLRFYAGYALTDQGKKIGSVCIRESVPRQLNLLQQRGLGVRAPGCCAYRGGEAAQRA